MNVRDGRTDRSRATARRPFRRQGPRRRRVKDRKGMSIVEAAVASAIVGVLLVAALRTVGSSVATQAQTAQRMSAQFLAEGMLSEATQKSYQDPDSAPRFGYESGESPSLKTTFDDVDDYDAWQESPPQNQDGTPMTGFDGWERQVTVEWIQAADVTQTAGSESGAKRVTVAVKFGGKVVTTQVAVRTAAP
jgi:type II secretory pathway pseudopilin PulG